MTLLVRSFFAAPLKLNPANRTISKDTSDGYQRLGETSKKGQRIGRNRVMEFEKINEHFIKKNI